MHKPRGRGGWDCGFIQKKRQTAPEEEEEARESGIRKSNCQGLHLGVSRHSGSWIREGKSRKDLGPRRGQITRPAPQTWGSGPGPIPVSQGTQESSRQTFEQQEPGRRTPSLPFTVTQLRAPVPSASSARSRWEWGEGDLG